MGFNRFRLAAPHLEGRGQLRVEGVEDVKHQDLQRVGGYQRMVRAQQPPLVERPCLYRRRWVQACEIWVKCAAAWVKCAALWVGSLR